MAITVNWDDDSQRIVRYVFDEHWTWEEFFKAVQEARRLIDDAPGDVGVIMDSASRRMKYPPNMLTNLRQALNNKHPRTQIIVVVVNNPFLLAMVGILAQISGTRGRAVRVAHDLPQARQMVLSYLDEVGGEINRQDF